MLIIPPSSSRSNRPATPHDTTVGMFVVSVVFLCIALVMFIVGPRSGNPPPPILGYVVSGLALLFGFIAFFSWMKEQSEDDRGNNSSPES